MALSVQSRLGNPIVKNSVALHSCPAVTRGLHSTGLHLTLLLACSDADLQGRPERELVLELGPEPPDVVVVRRTAHEKVEALPETVDPLKGENLVDVLVPLEDHCGGCAGGVAIVGEDETRPEDTVDCSGDVGRDGLKAGEGLDGKLGAQGCNKVLWKGSAGGELSTGEERSEGGQLRLALQLCKTP